MSNLGIKSMIRREDTVLRLGGMGDNYHMSWAADDRQLVAVCDGFAWDNPPQAFYNSRLCAIAGEPHKAVFEDLPGYPLLAHVLNTTSLQRYYGFGTLALEGQVYQYLSALNHPAKHHDGSLWPGARFVGAKIIYSPDSGRTWRNQDCSIPVVWEAREQRSPENMVFFEESQEAFSMLSILQMGRNYCENRDGYLYVYAPNGNTEGSMNELVMFRVPKTQLLKRSAYEYFGGRIADGGARWVKDIDARAIVHTFPRGWVNLTPYPWAWMPSVTHNGPLGLYMMATWGNGVGADGSWFSKQSYLGIWIAQEAWGPWEQIHEDAAWRPQGDAAARAYAPQIAPKWISKDGRSFWIVWADVQVKNPHKHFARMKSAAITNEDTVRYYEAVAQAMPFYGFNTQRIDVEVGCNE